MMKRKGMTPFTVHFAVVEAHRSGWPHLNLVIYAPELAEMVDLEQRALRLGGTRKRDRIMLRGELQGHATQSGWGRESTVEQCYNKEKLASYCNKIAGLSDSAAGEIAKLTQLPLNAPRHFRRLRTSKGFLPLRHGPSGRYTGVMIVRAYDPDGHPRARPISRVPECLRIEAERCGAQEDRIWFGELSAGAREGPFDDDPVFAEVARFLAAVGWPSVN